MAWSTSAIRVSAMSAFQGLTKTPWRTPSRKRRVASGGGVPDSITRTESGHSSRARMRSSVDLWFAQNATWRLLERLPELRRLGKAGDTQALQALVDLERLARTLHLVVPP